LARVLTTAVGQEAPVGTPPAICLFQRGAYRAGGVAREEPFSVTEDVQFGVRVNRGGWREALSLRLGPRPPSQQENVERIAVEFPLQLPQAQRIAVRFAIAAADGAVSAVTSRVRVVPFGSPAGEPGDSVYESRIVGQVWNEGEADLSRFAGRKIRLQLESAGMQSAGVYWAEPTLIVGEKPVERPSAAPSRRLGSAAGYLIAISPGGRGVLNSVLSFTSESKRVEFRGFQVRVLGDALEDWRSASELRAVRDESSGGRFRLRHSFTSWAGAFDLLSELSVDRGALQARFWLENAPAPRPWLPVYIEDVAVGPWSDRGLRRGDLCGGRAKKKQPGSWKRTRRSYCCRWATRRPPPRRCGGR
jgi:hypothetical protein